MNYKTYAEAKIANPDSEIVTTNKRWSGCDDVVGYFEKRMKEHQLGDDAWIICNPADYCSSVKEFLDAGFEFSVGDFWLDEGGMLESFFLVNSKTNKYQDDDENRYILSAAALNGGCKIPAKSDAWTVYNNTMPLCDLIDEQVGKLVKHSGCVEHMNPNNGEWGATITPMWNRSGIYRIKPKSERELFIDAAINHGIKPETQNPRQIFGELFDSGKFKYIDKTQHFGENI